MYPVILDNKCYIAYGVPSKYLEIAKDVYDDLVSGMKEEQAWRNKFEEARQKRAGQEYSTRGA